MAALQTDVPPDVLSRNNTAQGYKALPFMAHYYIFSQCSHCHRIFYDVSRLTDICDWMSFSCGNEEYEPYQNVNTHMCL